MSDFIVIEQPSNAIPVSFFEEGTHWLNSFLHKLIDWDHLLPFFLLAFMYFYYLIDYEN